jgi:hypothetical protein
MAKHYQGDRIKETKMGETHSTHVKTNRMRWAGHVACMVGDEERTQNFGPKT